MDRIHIPFIFAMAMMTSAVFCDLKNHRIPNRLILFDCGMGGLILLWDQGIHGLSDFTIGLAGLLVIAFVIYRIGAIGAGDAKLFAVLGGIFGVEDGLRLLIISFLLAAIPALICHFMHRKDMPFTLPMTGALLVLMLMNY